MTAAIQPQAKNAFAVMTQPYHYRYATCGNPAETCIKPFAHSKLSHVRFCNAYFGNTAADHDIEFEAEDLITTRMYGPCPSCLQQRVSNRTPDLALPAQVCRSSIVPHHLHCREDKCRRFFVIRKTTLRVEKPVSSGKVESSSDVARHGSQENAWSALFDEPGDSPPDTLDPRGFIVFHRHQEEESNRDFAQSRPSEKPRRKQSALRKQPTMLPQPDDGDVHADEDGLFDVDAGTVLLERRR
ncbi:hypothetical protein DOTSEDRAFT_38165 [Dothistroma septosporum NZE10]|uniref:Uncharacterized protein n=1 Tax=Dothistroma septosporum (strain NZE10 / CBS 128990) TaxID=675120 RepID=N1PFW8_DOTSN|nr:hypothetical protein DOTSEDRAFT_38165 [Dothistroma septosporum NZE10]